MLKAAILFSFLPLVAHSMESDAPVNPFSSHDKHRSLSLATKSVASMGDVEIGVGAPHETRRKLRTSAVRYGGPLNLKALRNAGESDTAVLSVLPVTAPSSSDSSSFKRAQPSTSPSSGVVMPYTEKPKRDPGAFPSSGVVMPPKWLTELKSNPFFPQ
ncbi:MAG: hypothetical protein K2Q34_07210 [Alphaproteobacteria bacterium]|nr:hypothetical protein [Alphaproteobacteria bacterium]